jgi:predicted permease
VGTLIAWWGVRGLLGIAPETMVRWQYNVVTVDARVLVFALVLTVLTGLLFGMVPAAWAARRSDATRAARGATASRSQMRARRLVQVVQIAMALVLLVGAGLLGRSFQRLASVDPGYDAARILELNLSRSAGRTADERAAFNRQLDARLRAVPGVEAVGWSNGTGLEFPGAIEVDDGRRVSLESRIIISSSVDTAFLRVMGIPILEGRGFTAADVGADPRPVIVDRDLAALLWPGQNALGRRYRRADGEAWYTVVGVVGDVKLEGPDDRQMPWNVYYATAPDRVGYAAIRIRTRPPPATLVQPVRQAVHELDPGLPINDLLPAREALRETIEQPRFVLVIMLVFAVLALVLSSIGVYGLVAFSVAQRSREIGIRMAVGARDSQVVRAVFAEGMKLAAAGVAIGLVVAVALARFIESLLFEVSTTDPAGLLLAPAVLALACAAALFTPARRAASVDPATTLRSD